MTKQQRASSGPLQRLGTAWLTVLRRACPGLVVHATIQPMPVGEMEGVEVAHDSRSMRIAVDGWELELRFEPTGGIVSSTRQPRPRLLRVFLEEEG